MKPTKIPGIYKKEDKLYTQNPSSCKGIKVYNEHLITHDKQEYRSWNPYRSKLAAALLKGLTFSLSPNAQVLYLGAATGTTVSHLSDILQQGLIYAVENSPIAVNQLLTLCHQRDNIIPLLEDAYHSERYTTFVQPVDFLYQDIAQRHQAMIFIDNATRYLKQQATAILMVKARSIDVSLKPSEAYQQVSTQLHDHGFTVIKTIPLHPYEKDHAAFLIKT